MRTVFFPLFLKNKLIKSLWIITTTAIIAACGHTPQTALTAGAADYRHYPEGGGLFVSAAFAPDGRLWRIVPEKHHVYVDYSDDSGQSFSPPMAVNPEEQRIKASGENRPGITVDRAGRIYVLYAAESVQPATLFYSVSADNGLTFSAPKPLSDKAAEANTFQGKFATGNDGRVYAVWHDERDRTDWRQLGNAIYIAGIDGKSGLAQPAQKLSDTLCDCCRIATAFDRNNNAVLLTRFIYAGGVRDHGLIKVKAGNHQAESWRVTFDDWIIEACPEHGPAISISADGRYHIAWFTQGKNRQGLFYAYSSDGGKHFSEPLPFGNAGKLPSHPDIFADGNHIILTWTEFDGANSELMVMDSNDNGNSWQQAKPLARFGSETDYPFILNHKQKLFVSWNSKIGGYRLIPLD